jgi:hypothetical protein
MGKLRKNDGKCRKNDGGFAGKVDVSWENGEKMTGGSHTEWMFSWEEGRKKMTGRGWEMSAFGAKRM